MTYFITPKLKNIKDHALFIILINVIVKKNYLTEIWNQLLKIIYNFINSVQISLWFPMENLNILKWNQNIMLFPMKK